LTWRLYWHSTSMCPVHLWHYYSSHCRILDLSWKQISLSSLFNGCSKYWNRKFKVVREGCVAPSLLQIEFLCDLKQSLLSGAILVVLITFIGRPLGKNIYQ
jgi:hypothetical protein